jgi:hypothetical protein
VSKSFLELWKEPLYRLILHITLIEIEILGIIILFIVFTREIRLRKEKKIARCAKALFDPLMRWMADNESTDEILDKMREFPKRMIALELEKYALMLDGGSLTKIRELYEKLDLRTLGMKLIRSIFWWRRLEGARLLGAAGGDRAVKILTVAIRDRHPAVKLAAVRSLGQIRSIKTIAPLLDLLSEAENMSRRQLAQSLIAFGSDVHPFLRQILKSGLSETVEASYLVTVIEVLALTGDIEAGPEIRAALTSPHMELRIASFKAAALLHLPLFATEIGAGLDDSEWPVRAQAAAAAGRIRDDEMIPLLRKSMTDKSWWVRSNAGASLFMFGPKGIAVLEEIALTNEDKFARDMAMRTLTSDPMYQVLDQGNVSGDEIDVRRSLV